MIEKLSKEKNLLIKLFIFAIILMFTSNCGKKASPDTPTNSMERARKNIEEGRGISIKNALKRNSTNYEFSSSNPLWRASLEVLDFMPLNTVDYSGGIIITDWYSDSSKSNESIKITLRFLTNEIRSDSLKIIIHQKKCTPQIECVVNVLNSKINSELTSAIIKKAALLEEEINKK